MPKINLPKIPLPNVNAWKQALDKPATQKYSRESPLIPQKGGYPIPLNMPTSGGTGIKLEDLESEPTIVTKKSGNSEAIRLVATYNPYLMRGATNTLREQNRPLEAENDAIAVSLASGWRGTIKQPVQPYKPLLKPNAIEPTEEELSTAISNTELEEKSKAEEKRAIETYISNERAASNPAGNPIWVLKTPGQGPRQDLSL